MNALTQTLVILGIILAIIMIIVFIYLFFTLRKVNIVSKKIDYLVEDITYKSEKLNVTVDAVVKLSNYVSVLEVYLEQNSKSVSEYITNNKLNLKKLQASLDQTIKQKEKDLKNKSTKNPEDTSVFTEKFDTNKELK